jgi:hypothetical protein
VAKVSASAYRSAYLSGAAALLRMLEDPVLRGRLLELLAKPRPSA